jgi:hypothetical protein
MGSFDLRKQSRNFVRPWEPAMPDLIFQANIARYKELLAAETDARKIAALRRLLVEEEANYDEWRAKNPKAAE